MSIKPVYNPGTDAEDIEAQIESGVRFPRPKPTRGSERTNTAFLDGLRGIAALCVFNQHLLGLVGQNHGFAENGNYDVIYLPFVRIFYSGGTAAVGIFFVLSGFVLSQTTLNGLQQRKQCRAHLVSAAIRRPLRLYLPCLAVTLVVTILMHLPYNVYPDVVYLPPQDSFLHELIEAAKYSARFFNPFQKHSFVSTFYPYNRVLWTIPIELKGSMLVYAVLMLLTLGHLPKTYATVSLSIVTMILLYTAFWWQACFSAGVLIAIVHNASFHGCFRLPTLRPRVRSTFAYGTFLAGFYLLCQPVHDGHPATSAATPGWGVLTSLIPPRYNHDNYYRFWLSCGAMLCVFSIQYMQTFQRFLCIPPLQFLGRVSFMVYITHEPIFFCVGDRWRRIIGHVGFGSEPRWWDNLLYIPEIGPAGMDTRWLVEWMITLSIVLTAAHFATRYIDEPCIRLSKQLPARIGLNGRKS